MNKRLDFNDLVIGENHPAIAGHFPNNPIVPAALELDIIAQRLHQHTGHMVSRFYQVRFIQIMRPNQPLQLTLEPVRAQDYRFTLASSDAIYCKGRLSFDVPQPSYSKKLEVLGATNAVAATPCYNALPHAGNMRLIDSILDSSPRSGYCVGSCGPAPIGDSATSATWVGLEYAAQAMACHGLLYSKQSEPVAIEQPMIVALKNMELTSSQRVGKGPLHIQITLLAKLTSAASCQFVISQDDQSLSHGQFSVAFQLLGGPDLPE